MDMLLWDTHTLPLVLNGSLLQLLHLLHSLDLAMAAVMALGTYSTTVHNRPLVVLWVPSIAAALLILPPHLRVPIPLQYAAVSQVAMTMDPRVVNQQA